ncbi:MAG: hypothetical protein JKX68_09465 [Flavobacteriales bacterium]|nr:hypothetical protein [Flavobacteriales bacterium]
MELTETLTIQVSLIKIVANNIIEIIVLSNAIVELEHIKHDMDYCKKISPNKEYHLILNTQEFSTITSEAREYSMKNMNWANSVSLVSQSLAHRMLFNFGLRIFDSKRMKMHKTREAALKWIASF